ncbi:MAG TPA: hypothetical protein VIP46_18455 [Pyrinomonadaceae bacterium]
MSRGISEREFRQLCDAVEGNATAILRDRGDLSGDAAMQRELFARLCHALEIDVDSEQAAELLEQKTGYSFAIMQTLEENMHPAFGYVDTLGPFLRRVGALA